MSSNKPGDSRPCVSCGLSTEMDRLITAQAERSGVSRAAVVRGVLERYFEHDEYPGKQTPVKGAPRRVWEGGEER